jgi:hypothetical protein
MAQDDRKGIDFINDFSVHAEVLEAFRTFFQHPARELGYELAFLPGCTLHPSSSQASSRHGPIAATREARSSVALI